MHSRPVIVESEFAAVEVALDTSGNGPRLRLRDLRSGCTAYLDALLLESLVWAKAEHCDMLLDPGWRWSSPPGESDTLSAVLPPASDARA